MSTITVSFGSGLWGHVVVSVTNTSTGITDTAGAGPNNQLNVWAPMDVSQTTTFPDGTLMKSNGGINYDWADIGKAEASVTYNMSDAQAEQAAAAIHQWQSQNPTYNILHLNLDGYDLSNLSVCTTLAINVLRSAGISVTSDPITTLWPRTLEQEIAPAPADPNSPFDPKNWPGFPTGPYFPFPSLGSLGDIQNLFNWL